jgi:hypothetical protein
MDIADLRACLEPGMRSRKSLEFPVPPVRGDEFAGASPGNRVAHAPLSMTQFVAKQ